MSVSVIIPTYQRPAALRRLLESLVANDIARRGLEVVVVDDGSSYAPEAVLPGELPYELRFHRQPNSGATVARNTGSRLSGGELLVFIDDDVSLDPGALDRLLAVLTASPNAVVIGNLRTGFDGEGTPFTARHLAAAAEAPADGTEILSPEWCNTQLLAVRRTDFVALNRFQDPTGGWPNWDDVDFGYRAHLAGMRVLRAGAAGGVHWDGSLRSLAAASRRWERAGRSAGTLLTVHPGLRPLLPMFSDMHPIDLSGDPPRLIGRKLARRLSATRIGVWFMERLVDNLEKKQPASRWLPPLYRWVMGAYMYRGLAAGR